MDSFEKLSNIVLATEIQVILDDHVQDILDDHVVQIRPYIPNWFQFRKPNDSEETDRPIIFFLAAGNPSRKKSHNIVKFFERLTKM